MMNDSFTVGFLGRRDSYQIPQALAEAGRLGSFVTGAYRGSLPSPLESALPKTLQSKLARRQCSRVSAKLVEAHWGIEAVQHLSTLLGDRSKRSWTWANRALSLAIRDRARKQGGHILTYEPYGWEAFTATYEHCPKKILFHFHLHPRFERALINEDTNRNPPANGTWLKQDARPEWDSRIVDLWHHADRVLCASTFTRSSLLAQGMPPECCLVVPYGIDLPEAPPPLRADTPFSVLFVGSGIQRKGLHHLLSAWKVADLPTDATLTVVSRFIDPVLESALATTPGVIVRQNVGGAELQNLFRDSTLFAMPSLLEGFGQVFLEALAQGCPVLGTPNTCLPDLGDESSGIFLVPAGEVNSLREKLEQLSWQLTGEDARAIRQSARETAEQFTWQRFRNEIATSAV
jgi:glycosyltransferase involved in cell wall biosynthesis